MINRRNFFGSVSVAAVAIGSKAVLGRDVTAKPQLTMDITPENALHYAEYLVKAPCPELEDIIAQDAHSAYRYASFVLDGPFTLGEVVIAHSRWAYFYATFALKGRFPLGEPAIAQDADYSRWYAEFLGGTFLLNGKIIYSKETGFKGIGI